MKHQNNQEKRFVLFCFLMSFRKSRGKKKSKVLFDHYKEFTFIFTSLMMTCLHTNYFGFLLFGAHSAS